MHFMLILNGRNVQGWLTRSGRLLAFHTDSSGSIFWDLVRSLWFKAVAFARLSDKDLVSDLVFIGRRKISNPPNVAASHIALTCWCQGNIFGIKFDNAICRIKHFFIHCVYQCNEISYLHDHNKPQLSSTLQFHLEFHLFTFNSLADLSRTTTRRRGISFRPPYKTENTLFSVRQIMHPGCWNLPRKAKDAINQVDDFSEWFIIFLILTFKKSPWGKTNRH